MVPVEDSLEDVVVDDVVDVWDPVEVDPDV